MLGAFVNCLVKALQSSLTRIGNFERSVIKFLSLRFLIFVVAVDTIKNSPKLEDLWQLHFSNENGAAHNSAGPLPPTLQDQMWATI
jgi:hypothetical protein